MQVYGLHYILWDGVRPREKLLILMTSSYIAQRESELGILQQGVGPPAIVPGQFLLNAVGLTSPEISSPAL